MLAALVFGAGIMTVTDFKPGQRFNADDNRWEQAKAIIGDRRVTLGPQASDQYLNAPEHLAMVLSRYRAAAALIGDAQTVLEIGCGEGIGAGILAKGRTHYWGWDSDAEAIRIAYETYGDDSRFNVEDVLSAPVLPLRTATVSLDVIEHIPAAREDDFMRACSDNLTSYGVMVIGTPNATFDHLASPQSRAGHINKYSATRLRDLMRKYFYVVQEFGMNDVALHLGHPEARHYLIAVGIGPKRG